MKKYKVELTQTETFIVDVYAKDETEAITLANESFQNGNYQETGKTEINSGTVYDVTDTDDPFYPVNEK